MQTLPTLALKSGRDRSLRKGHPWLFSGAIAKADPSLKPGDLAMALASDGTPVGLGFYNRESDIAFRLVTRDATATVDRTFWELRLDAAVSLRDRILPPETDAYRLVNAEGDGFPGLVADRYADSIVVSFATAGIEKWRDVLLAILAERLRPSCIVERSEGRSREREGLEVRGGVVYGEHVPEAVRIRENGLWFDVDVRHGQKTGFFLDQRPNRETVRRLSGTGRVLNAFSYTAAFSVYAAAGGASRVVSVDTSGAACEMGRRNLQLNAFREADHPVVEADVFSYLRSSDAVFDMVVLDPPAFAKTRADVPHAARGYKDANLQAIKHLSPGGYIMTFSCSNHVDETLFGKIVLGAVQDAGRSAQVMHILGPGPDHPVLLGHPEGRYLKGLLLRIL
jgi:23S rRNA (cytosine1962-C5)-methyltransferase